MERTAWLIVGWLVLGSTAQAASFDCGKAQSKVEKLICADAELSKLDEELNVAYKGALQDGKQADSIKQAQKLWMKGRNGCADTACLKLAYKGRLQRLASPASASDIEAIVQKRASPPDAKKGCYKLVVGKRFAMCREFEENLNRFCDEPPMVCRYKIHPDYGKDFSTPKWEVLDPAKNLELVAEIMRSYYRAPSVAIHPEDSRCDEQCAERNWQKMKPSYLAGVTVGRVSLERARFDLNHDDMPEMVYRLSGTQCALDGFGSGFPYFMLMVMDEQTGKENPDFATRDNAATDVLIFQGRAHLVHWQSEWILDGNATLGTTTWMPEGMSGGNFTIHDIGSGGPNVGRYYVQMRPVCGYNRLDKEEK